MIHAIPLDAGPTPQPDKPGYTGWTLIFSSEAGHRDLPVGYDVGVGLDKLGDRELTMLFDAAASDPV